MLKARKRDVNAPEKRSFSVVGSTNELKSTTHGVRSMLETRLDITERLLKNVSAQNVKLINLNQSLSRKIDDLSKDAGNKKTTWNFDIVRGSDGKMSSVKAS